MTYLVRGESMKRKGALAEASNNDNASLAIARSLIWRGHKLQRRRKRLGDTESSHEAKVSNNTFSSSRLESISDNSEATGIATEAKSLPQTISYDFSELSAASVKCKQQKKHTQRHVIGSAATRHRRRKTSMLQSVESAMSSSAAPLSNWQGKSEGKSIDISPREMELAIATCLLLVAPFLPSSIPSLSLSNHETYPPLRNWKQKTKVTNFDFGHVPSKNYADLCPGFTFPLITACVTLSVSIGFLSGTIADSATKLDMDKCHTATAQKCKGALPNHSSKDAQTDYQATGSNKLNESDKLEPCRVPQDVAVISLGPQSPRLLNGCSISVKADGNNFTNTQAVAMVTPAPPISQHFQQCLPTSQGNDKPVSTTSAINTTSDGRQSALDTSNRYTAENQDLHAKAETAIKIKQEVGRGAHPHVPSQRTNGHYLKKRTRETITESRLSILQQNFDYKRARVQIEPGSKHQSHWHDIHSTNVRNSIKQEHGDSFYRFKDLKPRLTGTFNSQNDSSYQPKTFHYRNQSQRNSFHYEPSSTVRYEDRTHISCMFSPVNTSRKAMFTRSSLRDFKLSFPSAVTTQIHNKKYGAFIRTNETDPADEEVTEIAKRAWDTNMVMTLQNSYMVSRQIQGTNNTYNSSNHHNYRRYGYHPTNYNHYNNHNDHYVSNRPNNPMAALFNYVEEENREYKYARRAVRTHHHNWSQEHQEPQRDYNDHHRNHSDYFICIERGHPRSESPMSDITVSPAPSFDDDDTNEPLDKNVDPNIFSTLPLDLKEGQGAGADNLYPLHSKQKEFRHENNCHHKNKDLPDATVSTPNSSFWKTKNNPNLWVNTKIYNQGPVHASCIQQPPPVPRVSPLKIHNRNFDLSPGIFDGNEPLRTVSPIRAFTYQERGSRIGCKNN